MSKSGCTPNTKRSFKVELFIFEAEEKFEFFIGEEVTHVGGNTPECHYMGALVEAEKAFFLIQGSECLSES